MDRALALRAPRSEDPSRGRSRSRSRSREREREIQRLREIVRDVIRQEMPRIVREEVRAVLNEERRGREHHHRRPASPPPSAVAIREHGPVLPPLTPPAAAVVGGRAGHSPVRVDSDSETERESAVSEIDGVIGDEEDVFVVEAAIEAERVHQRDAIVYGQALDAEEERILAVYNPPAPAAAPPAPPLGAVIEIPPAAAAPQPEGRRRRPTRLASQADTAPVDMLVNLKQAPFSTHNLLKNQMGAADASFLCNPAVAPPDVYMPLKRPSDEKYFARVNTLLAYNW